MDIKGAEFEVLNKLNSKILENIKNIIAECHLEAGDISQLKKVLKGNGHCIEMFTTPLVKREANYQIKVKNLNGLKAFRKLVYTLSAIVRAKDSSLRILFARR
jgi:hypothetical protein